jgi:flagellar hook-length control protein FliK
MAVPMEADVQANEVSQPAKDAAAPVTKSVEASATEAKPDVPFRMNVPASEFSQPVTKTSQPLTSQVPAVEIEEAVLKNKDGKSAPASVVENVAAESRLGGTNMPQIKNEAFVVEQKNAAVEIQFEKVAQAVRVEINPDEKVPAKDAERESVLDLDAAAVVGGVDRGEAGVKAAGKSFGAQVNPLAGDVIEQITSQVKARVKSGETSIRMQLNPGELGAIDVEMTHSAKGVSVSFITEQASTGQLIESQVNQLRQSLKDAGVQLVNLNISQHGQSYQEGGGFRQSQQFVQTSQRMFRWWRRMKEFSRSELARPVK